MNTPAYDPEPKLKARKQYEAVREKLSRPPSALEFYRESGISPRHLELAYGSKAFSKLVVECGDQPEKFGTPKSELRKILETWGILARSLGELPTVAEWDHRRNKPTAGGIRVVHGIKWQQLPREFLREFGTQADWQDVVAFIPASMPAEITEASKTADQTPLAVSQFLPPILSDLAALAQNETTAMEFERRVNLAFQILGFEVESLGQGTGRNPDTVARAPAEHFALIVDAKARNDSYVMGTEDRKFIEYIRQYQPKLAKQGCQKIYFIIISHRFSGRDQASIIRVKQETQVPVVEIRADQVLRIIAFMIQHPLYFDRKKFEQLLLQEGELTDNTIAKVLKAK